MELFKNFDNIETFEEIITCPITGQIFRHPVMTEDGQIFEKSAILTWFKINNTNPITRKKLKSKTLIDAYHIISIVDFYMNTIPDKQNMRYRECYMDAKYKIRETINNGELKLFDYYDFDLKDLLNQQLLGIIIKTNNYDLIKHVIDNGSNMNSYVDIYILNKSVKYNDFIIIEHICNKLTKLSKILAMTEPYNILNTACKYKDSMVINFLVEKGANINIVVNGYSILHTACINNNFDTIKYLVDKGINIDIRTEKGDTPFQFVCDYCSIEVIRYFIEQGVNVNEISSTGRYPIQSVCLSQNIKNQKEGILYLIENGADIHKLSTVGKSLLHYVAKSSNSSTYMFNYLIKKGLDISQKCNNGYTSLHLICMSGNYKLLKFILDKKFDVDFEATTNKSETPLHFACSYGPHKIIKTLVNLGCSLDKCDYKNNSVVHKLLKYQNGKIIPYILQKVDRDYINDKGISIIHYLFNYQPIKMIKKCLFLNNILDIASKYITIFLTTLPKNKISMDKKFNLRYNGEEQHLSYSTSSDIKKIISYVRDNKISYYHEYNNNIIHIICPKIQRSHMINILQNLQQNM